MSDDPYKYFRIEARELLDGMCHGALQLDKPAAQARDAMLPTVAAMLRHAHTLKGAARVVKQARIAELAHGVEDLLAPHRSPGDPGGPSGTGGSAPAGIGGAVFKLLDEIRAKLDTLDAPAPCHAAGQLSSARGVSTAQLFADSPVLGFPQHGERFDTVRVELQALDTLQETLMRARAHVAALQRQGAELKRARTLAAQLAEQLEKQRAVAGRSAAPILTHERRATALAGQLREQLERIEPVFGGMVEAVAGELSQAVEACCALRLLPAAGIFDALERSVRDAAQSTGKAVVFNAPGISGGAGGTDGGARLDAHVLHAVRDALLHVVRNAVAHGIEAPSARAAAGKPTAGCVTLRVERRAYFGGGRVAFICSDDGQGIDEQAVRRAALHHRLMSTAQLDALDSQAALQLIFKSGLSTAGQVTELSGRGVGLDMVRATVADLKGSVWVQSTPGVGATFEICVPVSLSSMTALGVGAGTLNAFIPLDAIREALTVEPAGIAYSAGGASILWPAAGGSAIPFVPLARLLDASNSGVSRVAHSRRNSKPIAVVVEYNGAFAAVGVERLNGSASVASRTLPAALQVSPVVAGMFLDAEGAPRLLLDPAGLVQFARQSPPLAAGGAGVPRAIHAGGTAAPPPRPPVLVIDDSLTSRMLEQNILASAGYDVEAASSAEAGLARARERRFGLFLVDVEMPGMNGFDFVERTRADPLLGKVPAILISSLNAPADRARGQSAGASAYIVKGEFDQKFLLETIRGLIG